MEMVVASYALDSTVAGVWATVIGCCHVALLLLPDGPPLFVFDRQANKHISDNMYHSNSA